MSVIKEFREFAIRGNVVDLAVGVIMGAAFGKLVTSLVNDVLMPPLGLVVGGVNFSHLKQVLRGAGTDAAGKEIPAVTLNYGAFLQNILDLFLVSLAVFVLVKLINRLRRQAPPPPAGPSREVELLTEIRDSLRHRSDPRGT